MSFSQDQKLSQWVEMFETIYGKTANYSRSPYEIHCHLTEVTGAFGKYLLKRKQPEKAYEFLPKMFAWSLALWSNLNTSSELDKAILTKYPKVCPYCASSPCKCEKGKKGSINQDVIKELYFKNAYDQNMTVNEFQMMFRMIYEKTWLDLVEPSEKNNGYSIITALYIRMIEELSEMAEAIRFFIIYPSNLRNEIADYLAWWFSIVSMLHLVLGKNHEVLSAESVLWPAYPGRCQVCMLPVCDCRPGPVREILSKPTLHQLHNTDALTQTYNRRAYDDDLQAYSRGDNIIPTPFSCIFIDVDNFRYINNTYNHDTGDEVLKYLVSIIRQKIRTRDKLYRYGGDEFTILCPDFSGLESNGMMNRVVQKLKDAPFLGKGNRGETEITILLTLSIGITECANPSQIIRSFTLADEAAKRSKESGRDRISISST